MTGLERILATFMGKPKDHTAATLTLSLYGARLTNCDTFEYYNDTNKYFEGINAIVERFNPDVLFTPFVLAAEGESFGSQSKYLPKYSPNIKIHSAATADQMLDIEIPDVNNNPRLLYFREATRLMANKHGKQNAIAGVMVSPVDLAPLIMGLDLWIETILFSPEKAKLIIDRLIEFFVERANAFFDDGVNVIALPIVFCNPVIMTEEIIKDLVLPAFKNAFSRVNGPIVLHHGGNPMNKFLHQLVDLPNSAVFVVDHKDKLEESRRIVGNDKVLMGNIDGPTLNKYSVPHIGLLCRQILENRRDDSHFILATSSADVAWDTPPEIIDIILDCARNFQCGN